MEIIEVNDYLSKISVPILNMMLVLEFMAIAIYAAKNSIIMTRKGLDQGCHTHRLMAKYLVFSFIVSIFYAIGEYTWITNGSYLRIAHIEDIMWVMIELSAALLFGIGIDTVKSCMTCEQFDYEM